MRAGVRGRSRRRWPVAWATAFAMAPTTGIITTSAMPLAGSLGDNGGRISAVWVHTAQSLARGSW
ncbi:hypothetical protein D9M68_1009700 [compost metagenome]